MKITPLLRSIILAANSWTHSGKRAGAGDDACCDPVISDGGISRACGQ